MEAFSILTQIQEQLGRTNDLDQLLNTTAGLVKELTGFQHPRKRSPTKLYTMIECLYLPSLHH